MELKGLKTLEMKKEAGRTCFVLVEIEGSDENSKNIFFYGHLDKQPHCLPWKEGLGPTSPVLKDGKLYGRGSSDDGYAPFAATMIMKLL
jgi:acetylornithine deacetylase/succinyl-diaminopimelate desuccinylase-like protein